MTYCILTIDGKAAFPTFFRSAALAKSARFSLKELERVAYPNHVVQARNVSTKKVRTVRGEKAAK